ncbi:unnamed protein product [Ostreobium quekettii]|uniref:Protein kinase domain-containing protein n=1 Tax=Ostreobium quekettii TaxID=121088 RepID=A0A8S1J5Z1_9CHLO|nr:unnamed protein product [Ostreobium quekettii]|eukprot:evm.model.scf_561EXC.8 EVM.evm.TU.scf_561EXC.8   scf_561EXC:53993-60168(-)
MQRMQPQCNKFDIRIHSVSHDPTVIVQSTFGPVEVGSFTDEHGDTVPVAVKYGTGLFATRAPQEVVRIFRSELEILHKVPTHPHIVCCYGGRVDFKEGDHIDARDVYIVQELMHNTLEAIIHGDQFDGNIPCNLIIKLALDIASGLEHLQEYSVMHYNLNTANIYLDDSLRNAKISDFGASQVNVESCITDALGGKAGCLGSEVLRKFIAPEVLLSYITKRYMINEKSCVYSLGVVLWEMLQGKLDDQAMEQLGSAESSGVQGFSITRPCPECLVQLVHDCVSMDVSTRPAVHEVRKKLQDMTFLAQWIVDKVEVDFSDGPPGVTQVGSVGVTRVTKAATLTDSVDDEFQEDVRGLNYDIRIHPVSNTPTIIRQDTFGTVELGSFTDEQGEIVQVAVRYFTDLFNTKTAREVAEICRSELKISQRLPMHPNIVCCYGGRVDFKEDKCIGDRDVYIVEELMRSSLREMIYGDLFDGKIPIKLILKFALDIASGLEHLHKCSVIHYDLKPANILVGNKLEVAKISDFGISKVKTGSYITGSMHGTFGYMAPEVMVSNFINVDINEKIDIYGLGVIIWEMIEAKPPYDLLDNGSGSTGKSSAIEERFTISRPCPEPLKQLVFDCVSLSSDDRPTAQEARQWLQEMSDTHT